MMQLVCPFCGPRELDEFEFRKTVPSETGSSVARIYLHAEDAQLSVEHWQHVSACRAWLLVRRNPSTGLVLAVETLGADGS
jgi:sarcosine oxidase delta subunit